MRLVLIGFVPWLVACSSLERAAECRAIADVVNPGTSVLEEAMRRTPVDFRAIERESNLLAKELRAVALTDASLRRISRELADNFTRLGEAAVAQSSSLRGAEPNVESARNWYGAFVTRYAQQVRAMKGHCRRD